MSIGPLFSNRPIALAPMAGVSDRPTRSLCKALGADYAVSEMLASQTALWSSRKSQTRLNMANEAGTKVMQIAGSEPAMMAHAAASAEQLGADVLDINMGCPAKKVCNKLAGSALLQDESLVRQILRAVVAAVDIPVTLKTRTGWNRNNRNGVNVAKIAEDSGIQALTMHGRTRECAFRGEAEYDTIAQVKAAVSIPVIANGDIRNGDDARAVLAKTGADGLMIGRAAQGNPWIFAEIKAALDGLPWQAPTLDQRLSVMTEHLNGLHHHYGEFSGARIARKHIGWYLNYFADGQSYRREFNRLESAAEQRLFLERLGRRAPMGLAA